MDVIVDDDFRAVLLDDADSPTKMMQFPTWNVSTLEELTSASEAQAQAESYIDRFEELSIDYISREDQAEEGKVLDLASNSASVRSIRNTKLAESDWMGLSDTSISAAWVTYRQALRDITDHENFPVLEDSDWPVEPNES